MKKKTSQFLILSLLLVSLAVQPLAGCGKTSGAADAPGSSDAAPDAAPDSKDNGKSEKADVDLTILSSTMVYAEVNSMTVSPEDYLGKTIRLSGSYYSAYYDQTDTVYHFVLIADAASCCQQGLEFVLEQDRLPPDGYPADLTEVEIFGTYSRYEELGQVYYYVAAETLVVL
jgi:hypothetical protein